MSDPVFKDRPMHAKDPLRDEPPDARALLSEFGKISHGASFDTMINVAANVIISVFRQQYKTRGDAERKFDEVFGKSKSALMRHYDSTTGSRRGVFAFDQTVNVDLDRIMAEMKAGTLKDYKG